MCNHCPLTFSNNDSKVRESIHTFSTYLDSCSHRHIHQVCHERTHTEKKMECPFCEMRFCVETSLRKHSKIHEKQLAGEL